MSCHVFINITLLQFIMYCRLNHHVSISSSYYNLTAVTFKNISFKAFNVSAYLVKCLCA